ncbi:MAG: glutaredoxin family protein [Candidatus Brocadiales bacterium]
MNPTDELLVFTQETCPKCDEAKKKLSDAGLKYREICIDTVEGRADFALHISKTTTTPAFLYNGVEYDKVEDVLSQQG